MINHATKTISHENLCGPLLSKLDGIDMDGWTVDCCNVAQKEMNTPVFAGKKVTFKDSNCMNVKADKHIFKGCNTCQREPEPEKTPEEIEAEAIDIEVQEAVDKIAELSFKYPDKVSAKLTGKVDKPTTEALLSANGKPKTINAPEGW